MNFTVHALMYSYYGCRALRFKIPKWVNILITFLQILQMIIGVYINVAAYIKKYNGGICEISYKNLNFAFFMYFSYFILFSIFFVKAYLIPKKSEK